jgi:hypothetical protein
MLIDTSVRVSKHFSQSHSSNLTALFKVFRLVFEDTCNNAFKLPRSGIRRQGRFNAQYIDRRANLPMLYIMYILNIQLLVKQ